MLLSDTENLLSVWENVLSVAIVIWSGESCIQERESVINDRIVISYNILIWFGEFIYLILSSSHSFNGGFVECFYHLRVIRRFTWYTYTYLIFVHSINSGASVKKLTEGNFFSQLMRKGLLTRYLCTQCYFTYNASFYTQCGIWLTVCNFTQSV